MHVERARDRRMTPAARLSDRVSALRIALHPGTSASELRRVAAAVDEWEAHEGEALYESGVVQGFVVLSGTATVNVDGEPVARLAPGGAFWPSPVVVPVTVTADCHMWLLMVAPADQHLFLTSSAEGPAMT